MSEVISALAFVKDPVTLFAFIALLLLAAFQTKSVPYRFFKLADKKLTQQHYFQLLRQFMRYALIAFVVALLLSIAGNVAAAAITPKQVTIEEYRAEIARAAVDQATRDSAEQAYQQALDKVERATGGTEGLAEAIKLLQRSVELVPSQAAYATMALLQQRLNQPEQAELSATRAREVATARGDQVGTARADRLLASIQPGEGLIGPKDGLPAGGSSFEQAAELAPGRYILTEKIPGRAMRYYRYDLQAGQTLRLTYRIPDVGGNAMMSLHNRDGGLVKTENNFLNERSLIKKIEYRAQRDERMYVSVGRADPYDTTAQTIVQVELWPS